MGTDASKKREFKRAYLKQQKVTRARSFALSQRQFSELQDYLQTKLEDSKCSGALRYSLGWEIAMNLPADSVLHSVQENGAFCDCEVLMNIDQQSLFE
ncbi:MAG: DUF2695 domain-containing protein [Leptospiraceae bacterium]|nr:DUF2695 domain-containing protein [Leptospiraceae bacterium]MCP5485785.1 DUF2695 domain-containing protein [Spirochaetales bacterium]